MNFKFQQEARVPLQVWVTEKKNDLVMEDGQSDGKLLFKISNSVSLKLLNLGKSLTSIGFGFQYDEYVFLVQNFHQVQDINVITLTIKPEDFVMYE